MKESNLKFPEEPLNLFYLSNGKIYNSLYFGSICFYIVISAKDLQFTVALCNQTSKTYGNGKEIVEAGVFNKDSELECYSRS